MKMKSIRQVVFLFVIYLHFAYSFIDLSYFKTFMSNLIEEGHENYANWNATQNACGENQLMIPLATKHITSPEKILLLLATDSLDESCEGISDTIKKMNQTQTDCVPLPSEHLYMKLLRGTQLFYSNVCPTDSPLRTKIEKKDCLSALYVEFIECEGTPDWFEYKDRDVRCSIFQQTVKCYFSRAVALCGLKAGETIRDLAIELLLLLQPKKSKCEVTKSLKQLSAVSQGPIPYAPLFIILIAHRQF